MKNAKRILALVAAILLFGMYLSTSIFALIGSPAFHRPSLGLYCMYDCASGTSLWLYAGIQAYPA